MENRIDLYNIEYDESARTQPYFVSDTARDNYLASLPVKLVNKVGVNIKIDRNYEIEAVIDVDVVNMDNYNFVVFNYNNRNYYCTIDDYEMVSVGYTRIFTHRNVLFEITNYLDNFEKFNISKYYDDTINIYDFSRHSYIKPSLEYRRYRGQIYPDVGVVINGVIRRNVKFKPVRLLYISNNIPTKFGSLPTSSDTFPLIYVEDNYIRSVNGMSKNYYTLAVPIITDFVDETYLSLISPYIISSQFVLFPYIGDELLYSNSYFEIYENTGAHRRFNHGYIIDLGWDEKKHFFINSELNALDIAQLHFFNSENAVPIDIQNLNTGSENVDVQCDFYFYYDTNGVGINVKFLPQNNSNLINDDFCISSFNINYDTGFNSDSEAKWNSENRYYSEMTAATVKAEKIKAVSNFGQNLLAGSAEIATSLPSKGNIVNATSLLAGSREIPKPPRGANLSGISLGIGNIGRAIGGAINAAADIEQYEETRRLTALQEQALPDSYNSGNFPLQAHALWRYQIYISYERVTPVYKEYYTNMCKNYGVDTILFLENYGVPDTEFFVLKGIAYKKETSLLTDMQYVKLYKILQNGFRYKVIQ